MSTQAKFRAFLSYSRKDEAMVRRLHRRLERFEIPKSLRTDAKRTLGRIFRDKDELSAAAELGDELSAKLNEAEYLIVCCSPAAAQSKWVNAEIEQFVALKGRDRVLAAILEGEPQAAFPAALRANEPLAADFRKQGDGEEMGFLKLVAGLLRVDLGELRDRQAAAERTRARARAALIALFAFLAIGASVSAVLAVQQSRRAEAMALEAVDIGAGVVDKADELSRRHGVPISAVRDLMQFAQARYDKLFKAGVKNHELERRQALLTLSFAKISERLGDSKAARDNAEKALAQFRVFNAKKVGRSRDFADALAIAGSAALAMGDEKAAKAHFEEAIDFSRAYLSFDKSNEAGKTLLASALTRLGELHMKADRPSAALPFFEEAEALLASIAAAHPDDDLANANAAAALDWLGGARFQSGDVAGGKAAFQLAAERARAFAAANPESAGALSNLAMSSMKLGQSLLDSGDPSAARAALAESVAVSRKLLAADPEDARLSADLALRLGLSANAAHAQNDRTSADAALAEAASLGRALLKRDPANLQMSDTMSEILSLRAAWLQEAGAWEAAKSAYQELAPLRRRLHQTQPENIAWARKLSKTLELLGDASAQTRDLPSMLKAYEEAAGLRREIAASDKSEEAKSSLAAVLHALGLTRKFAKDEKGALAALQEAVTLRRALLQAEPDDAQRAYAAIDSLQQLALVQAGTDGAATRQSFIEARGLLKDLVRRFPNDARYVASLKKTEDVIAMIDQPR